jgi:superfamily II DNA or RNA helicase/nicotinamide mononucleotide adenylyltransferase
MLQHDIVDNRTEKLADHIRSILDSTEAARFAVGYFFVSGLESVADRLRNVKELRLLIGNTTNRETLEQIAEGYRRLEMVAEVLEGEQFPKRADIRRMTAETVAEVRAGLEQMDQTDAGEALVKTLAQLIEEQRLKVRVYTKGRLHAKAYIFDYADIYDWTGKKVAREEQGVAIVGSSNFTLAGVSHNTELNVVVRGNGNHAELVQWFDTLWDEAEDFDEALMHELRQSWAAAPVRPYDIYMKTLYTLVRERVEGTEDAQEVIWESEIAGKLADFQKIAVRQAIQIIRDFGGAFVADVVGLGKSFIGAAIVKHFEQAEHARPLILCPAALVDMWERYNEIYDLNARVLSTGYLREGEEGTANLLLDDVRYRDRDFVLIDESHYFRYPDTQRYRLVQAFLAGGKRCCLITATPRNKSAMDVYHQIKLFHQDELTDLPIDPPNLREYFGLIEQGKRQLPDLLAHILIRRTRNHILRWYGYDSRTNEPVDPGAFHEYLEGKRRAYVNVAGKHQFFPRRELQTVEYSIEDTYRGLYQQLRGYLGASAKEQLGHATQDQLSYARYGLWHYVQKSRQKQEPYTTLHRAGINLRGLVRILLFKRFESSVHAFRETVRRMVRAHEVFLAALAEGIVPAGEEAQYLLYESDRAEESDLLDELRRVSRRYDLRDFDGDRLQAHIEHDLRILRTMLALVQPITPEQDAKLQTLKRLLERPPLRGRKRLIFTQYADTAQYLYDNLNPGGQRMDIEVIYSGDKSKARIVGRFAPQANPEYRPTANDTPLETLIATDVLAEGLNLQDCDNIINYDLHWNPVRLIQRFGRIDRIGSDHDVIYGFNFLPETGLDRNLGLQQKLGRRIQEIHDTIGEDAAILDKREQLNESAMYAIYEQKDSQLDLWEAEDADGDLSLGLSEAEEIMRQLRAENPGEYERIAALRNGIRTARGDARGRAGGAIYVFCAAGRYQQLFIVDEHGAVVTRETPRILGTIKAAPDEHGETLPKGYNERVMRVKRLFAEEVKHRQAERDHTLSLTLGQRYVLKELRLMFAETEDEDRRGQINILERTFRGPVTTAISRQLNVLRRSGVRGDDLLKTLVSVYQQHGMRNWQDGPAARSEERPVPVIVCSEAIG